MRKDQRKRDELRPLQMEREFISAAQGRVLVSSGRTTILCTASVVEEQPKWMSRDSEKGWITAEYRMLPGSTRPRTARSDRPDGRSTEIQRLIGRVLRSVVQLEKLGPRTIYIDCDVLFADGGTRTASITGAFVALVDAICAIRDSLPDPAAFPLTDSVAAISVGIVNGESLLDLDYSEDVDAEVDMNLVMTGSGRFIEIQGTGEEATFSESELGDLLHLGKNGIKQLTQLQREVLGGNWPF
ncbi:MAG: ribonuclease PH [Thermoguttaceae bacterium]